MIAIPNLANSANPNRTIAPMTIPPAMVTISLLPMTPWLLGGVTGSRAGMGAHIRTAFCDVAANMCGSRRNAEAQQNQRLSPHSTELYHQETH